MLEFGRRTNQLQSLVQRPQEFLRDFEGLTFRNTSRRQPNPSVNPFGFASCEFILPILERPPLASPFRFRVLEPPACHPLKVSFQRNADVCLARDNTTYLRGLFGFSCQKIHIALNADLNT